MSNQLRFIKLDTPKIPNNIYYNFYGPPKSKYIRSMYVVFYWSPFYCYFLWHKVSTYIRSPPAPPGPGPVSEWVTLNFLYTYRKVLCALNASAGPAQGQGPPDATSPVHCGATSAALSDHDHSSCPSDIKVCKNFCVFHYFTFNRRQTLTLSF